MLWIILALVVSYLIYKKVYKPLTYWRDQDVSQSDRWTSFVDNFGLLTKKWCFPEMMMEFYNRFPNERYAGVYQFFEPILLIRDPDLIKQITVKDFDHFTDHKAILPEKAEPLWASNLFALTGTKWKQMRATLSPTFTSSKMKMMFVLMSECGVVFTEKLFKDIQEGLAVDMKDLCSRYANDVIATTAFGIKVDSYSEPKNEFYTMGRKLTKMRGFKTVFKFVLFSTAPKLGAALGLKMFHKDCTDFLTGLVTHAVKTREEQGIIRPDLIHLLMEAKKGNLKDEEEVETEAGFATVQESDIGKSYQKAHDITHQDICAQALIFFFAGFESVSTMMCLVAYELAVNPDIQDRLRREIDETYAKCKGKLTYEDLMKMKYMDMVVCETLRKWPGGAGSDRKCTKDYTIEPVKPGEKPVHIKKGQLIWLPMFGIHRDPDIYPDPEKFDPERFNDENKRHINPYTYIAFGIGPRSCIGSRFALMEMKIIFFYLLLKMELVPNEKTPIPFVLDKTSFALTAKPGFFMDLKRRA